ncbi:MAG TPA: hypothetical protein VGH91_07070 [Gammaproteobacteria bacterium]
MSHKNLIVLVLVIFASIAMHSAHAVGHPQLIRLYHLEPLTESDIKRERGLIEFLQDAAPKSDRRVSAIYIVEDRNRGTLIGIYWKGDNTGYYLLSAQDDDSKLKETTLDIPGTFADDFSAKLGTIISGDTRYAANSVPLLACLGAKDYVFESWDLYGTTMDCVSSGRASRLIQVAKDLIALTDMSDAPRDQQDAKMDSILSALSAVISVDQQPYRQPDDKQACKKIRGEYEYWNAYPISEQIKEADGKAYSLLPSLGKENDLQIPQYSLPDTLQASLDAHEDPVGEFLVCPAAYERQPIEIGWIKSFMPADASAQADFVRKIKIAALQAALTYPASLEFHTVEVSFDYLDGVVSEAKIERTDYKLEDDTPMLAILEKSKYPVPPEELKEKKLHIDLPIYLGAGD